jgi:hypothetical protein
MKLDTVIETKHKELLLLINRLVDFMTTNGFSFLFVAGKEGTCTRHLRGNYDDVHGMITGMMEKNKQVEVMFTEIVNEFKPKEQKITDTNTSICEDCGSENTLGSGDPNGGICEDCGYEW